MKRIVVICLGLFAVACSNQSDMEGKWKNSDNATLELKDDTTAIMGQEGIDGDVKGTYWTSGDTVWVKSASDFDPSEETYNLFTFFHRDDSLQLLEIALYRGDESETLDGEEFARRLGKRSEDMAFVRVKEQQ